MIDLLKKYISVPAVSGDEHTLAKIIKQDISPYADSITDMPLGGFVVYKKGKKPTLKKVMADAHLDEIGFIITDITDEGYLKFDCVGGIEEKVLLGKNVIVGKNKLNGVIGGCAVHLLSADEKKKTVPADKLYIDIGAENKEQAAEFVSPGDYASFASQYYQSGNKITARALDDRVGCAILADMIKGELEYDCYFSFSVQEEIGCRGAGCAASYIAPDAAIAIEATTAADIAGVADENSVCRSGEGAVVSFMDRATVYDKRFFDYITKNADKNGIKVQIKRAVAGGNNAGAIHKSLGGIPCAALSLACRYIHSQSCVADINDIYELRKAAEFTAMSIASGELG